MTRRALERRAILDERHRGLAHGTGEDFEQLSVDWHDGKCSRRRRPQQARVFLASKGLKADKILG
jgi:hypothetical protein